MTTPPTALQSGTCDRQYQVWHRRSAGGMDGVDELRRFQTAEEAMSAVAEFILDTDHVGWGLHEIFFYGGDFDLFVERDGRYRWFQPVLFAASLAIYDGG